MSDTNRRYDADPEWLSRLLLAPCLAYLWVVCLDVCAMGSGSGGCIVKTAVT